MAMDRVQLRRAAAIAPRQRRPVRQSRASSSPTRVEVHVLPYHARQEPIEHSAYCHCNRRKDKELHAGTNAKFSGAP